MRRASSISGSAWCTSRPATCCGPPWPRAPSFGLEGQGHHGRKATSYPTRSSTASCEERLGKRRRRLTRGFLLDGFPRTVGAGRRALLAFAGDDRLAVWRSTSTCPSTRSRRRMMARGRDDDTEEAIARRLVALRGRRQRPCIEWFDDRGILVRARRRCSATRRTSSSGSSPSSSPSASQR